MWRVLVVDDDEGFLRYAERALSAAGHRCRLVTGLAAARAVLAEESFDAVVLDIHLPDGSGIDLLLSLPELCAELPVILATGEPSVATAVQALRLEAMDYLTKPDVELEAAVERAIRRFRGGHRAEAGARDKAAWAAQLRMMADYLEASEPAGREPSLPRERGAKASWALLSRREAEVVRGLLMGHAPAQVAANLGIGLSTVRNHIQSAYRRLGVRSQLELIAKLRSE